MYPRQPEDGQRSFALQLSQLRKLGNDKALLRLDRSLRRFNVFVAMGAVRQELRHSDFLAFLLNPYSSHNLKGRFTEILLSEVQRSTDKARLAPFLNKRKTFDNAEVRREWENIDILLLCRSSKLALIIENKIDSFERDDQLKRYWETVVNEFRGCEVRGVYLTPQAEETTNRDYIPVGYETVDRSLKKLLEDHSRQITGDFKVGLKHYHTMITQKITRQLEDKCWDIYTKHQHAFDLVRDYVDQSDPIRRYLKELIQASPKLKCSHDRRGYVQFQPARWGRTTFLSSKRRLEELFFFEFQYGNAQHAKGSVMLLLAIDDTTNNGKEPIQAFNRVKKSGEPFKVRDTLTRFPVIFRMELLSRVEMDNWDLSAQKKKIRHGWNNFLSETLPVLDKAIRKQFAA